jgi:serine protease Do
MTGTRSGTIACGLVAALALLPSAGSAQASAGGGRVTGQARAPLNRVCAELASTPTTLTRAPEGRALLRMNKELEGAQAALDTRGQRSRVETERMSEVQRGVDSLMQIVVQRLKDQDGKERMTVTVRGASGARATAQSELQRGQVVATIRSLQPQIEALMGTVARGAVRIPMPTGWMGVYLSSSARTVPSPEGMLTYYCDYPVIEAVHAGSPAEKGGLLAGDTLLAYNGRDVRADAVNLTTLLVPKRTVRVKFVRDGRTREVPLVITEAPQEGRVTFMRSTCPPGGSCPMLGFSVEVDTVRGPGFVASPGAGAASGSRRVIVRGSPGAALAAPMPAADIMLAGTGMAVLAGAQLSVIDEEFAEGMGVEPGVLVLRVPRGTPASDAGLRPGDVIRALNGMPLRDMLPLQQALGNPGVRQVKLTVNAKGAPPRIVTLRW